MLSWGKKNLKSVFSINIIMVTKFRDDLNVTTLKNRYSQNLIFYILLIIYMVYSKMLSYGHLMVHKQEHHTEREREKREREREISVTVSTDYFHPILNDYRCQSKEKNRSSYKVYAMIVLF